MLLTSVVVILAGLMLLLIGWWVWQSQVLNAAKTATLARTAIIVAPLDGIPEQSPTTTTLPVPTTLPARTEQPLPLPQRDPIPLALDDTSIQQAMLDAINRDRQNNGLQPVDWDTTAAYAGALHAADMAANNYFSHWNTSGHGPEYRYNQAGGHDSVRENIFTYSYRFDNGQPAPINDFVPIVQAAQESLMNSPGHRANILAPEHTHVGVGFAYNPQTGSFYLAQEFVNRYVAMQPLPLHTNLGEALPITGTLLPEASNPSINLTYQPFPESMDLTVLNTTGSYQRDAEIYQAIPPDIRSDGTFQAQAMLDYQGQVGLYSVRIWVTVQGQSVLASEWLVEVE